MNRGKNDTNKVLQEDAKRTTVVDEVDVLVAGGGPAGAAAAIAAGRAGARVRLLEAHGSIGGIWSAGLLTFINDCGLKVGLKTGLMKEIIDRLEERDAGRRVRERSFICDGEELKLLLEEMVQDAGVQVQLHTRVVDSVKENDRMRYVITESKSGRQAWGASVFIDATGDGDMAALAGCEYEWGHPETKQTQPFSMIALIAGPKADEIKPYLLSEERFVIPPQDELRRKMEEAGMPPSYSRPCLWHVRNNLYVFMANHEYGYNGVDAGDITLATFHARDELDKMVKCLKALGGVWKDVHVVSTAEQIGVREGRRIMGLYQVTKDDLIAGVRHDDAVCRVEFGIDIHSLDPARGKGHDPDDKIPIKPYDIPLRALIAKDVRGLMMAGRCISGDFWAHASYRVTGDAIRLGQAAGITAALAVKDSIMPEDVSARAVQELLEKPGRMRESAGAEL